MTLRLRAGPLRYNLSLRQTGKALLNFRLGTMLYDLLPALLSEYTDGTVHVVGPRSSEVNLETGDKTKKKSGINLNH